MLDTHVSNSAYLPALVRLALVPIRADFAKKSLTVPGKTYGFFSQEWVFQGLGCFASKKFNVFFKTYRYGRHYPWT